LLPFLAKTQGECDNLNFEKGSFEGWSGQYGCNDERFDDFDIHFNNSCGDFGTNLDSRSGQINSLQSQHAIVANSYNNGQDPYVNILSLQSPLGGNYIARIGDLYENNMAGEITKKIVVSPDNALLTLYYAIVLEAPGHTPKSNNPYFRVRLIDPSGNSVPCIEYTQDGANDAEGFQAYNCGVGGISCQSDRGPEGRLGEIVFRDWTVISINLQDYIGQEIELNLSAGGCALSGHLGYAYVDAKCGKPEIIKSQNIVCPGNPATLTAPIGMENYQWRIGSPTGTIVSTENPFMADQGGTYYCTMTPFSSTANKCPFTLNTTIIASSKLPHAAFDILNDTICAGGSLTLESKSTIIGGGDIEKFIWNLSNGSTGNGESYTLSFPTAGTYTIKHTVESSEGCIDTISKKFEVFESYSPQITPVTTVCNDDNPFNLSASPPGGTWTNASNPNGTVIPGQYLSDTTINVGYTLGHCKNTVSTPVKIESRKNAFFTPPEPMCSNEPAIFLTPTTSGGSWIGNSIDNKGKFVPAVAGPGWHKVTYMFSGLCGSSHTDSILVYPSKNANLPNFNPVCVLDSPFEIDVQDEGGSWTGDATNNLFNPNRGPGTYTLIYSFDGNCRATDTTIIVVVDKSNAAFALPPEVCVDEPRFSISVSQEGGTISGTGIVSVQQKTFDPAVAGVGNHSIQYLIGGKCGDTLTQNITVLPRPEPSFDVPTLFCISDADYTIQPTESGGTWSGDVDANGTFSPSNLGPGEYHIRYSFSGTCPAQYDTTITVVGKPDPFFSVPDTLCSDNDPINIEPNTAGGNWNTNAPNGIFSPNKPQGNYTLEYSFTGTCSAKHSATIYVKKRVDVSISGKKTFCKTEGSTQFTATPASGYFIGSFISTNGKVDFASMAPGNYTFDYEVSGSCGDKKSFSFTLIETPNANFTVADTICLGESVQATAVQIGGTWSGAGINHSGLFSSEGLAPNTQYAVDYSFSGSCAAKESRNIFVQSYEDAAFSGPLSACTKEPAFGFTPLNQGGVWAGIADASGFVDPSLHVPDQQYEVIYSIAGKCPDSDTLLVTIRDFYRTYFDAPGVVCRNASPFNLESEDRGGGWFGDGITDVLKGTFDPLEVTGDTAIIHYVFNGVCGSSHTDTIVLKDAITPSFSNLGIFCWDTDSLLQPTVTPPNGVFVYENDTLNDINLNPKNLPPGIHTVYYGIDGDCPAFVPSTLEISEPFTISNIAITAETCFEKCDAEVSISTQYNSTNGLNYMVYNSTDTLSLKKNADGLCGGNYNISVSDYIGCKLDSFFTVTSTPKGEIYFHGSPSFCGNDNGYIKLDSTKNLGANGYIKLNGQLYGDSVGGLPPGKYVFEYLSAQGGCSVIDSIDITHANGPSLTTAFIPPSCFENDDASAYVDNIYGGEQPYAYLWNTGETTDNIDNKAAGDYSLTVTDKNGCTVSSNITIHKPDALQLQLQNQDTSICAGDSVLVLAQLTNLDIIKELKINGKAVYTSPTYLHNGTHLISAISKDGCKTDTLSLQIGAHPSLAFGIAGIKTEFCPNELLTLTAVINSSASTPIIDWENGNGTEAAYQRTVNTADNETFIPVTLTDICSSISDSIQIQVKSAPNLALNNFNSSGCEPLAFAVFDTVDANAQYFLNNTAIEAFETRNLAAGIYDLRVIVSNGICSTDSTIFNAIEVFDMPDVRIISTPTSISTLYPEGQFTDASSPPLASKEWSIIHGSVDTLTQSTERSLAYIFPEDANEYKIELDGYTADGCYGRSRIYISVKDEFHVFVPNSFTPNGDGHNDFFSVTTQNIDIATYKLEIVDRWGHVIFETDDPNLAWNGSHYNSDEAAPIGVYNWKITILDTEGRYIPKIGHLNLLR
jgi:gliding motility-associated-like protein